MQSKNYKAYNKHILEKKLSVDKTYFQREISKLQI